MQVISLFVIYIGADPYFSRKKQHTKLSLTYRVKMSKPHIASPVNKNIIATTDGEFYLDDKTVRPFFPLWGFFAWGELMLMGSVCWPGPVGCMLVA